MRTLFILFTLLAVFCFAEAQEPAGEQRITENGKTYILYRVKTGETLYAIGKRFNVPLPLLTGINPQATDGLKAGEILKIPAVGDDQTTRKESNKKDPTRFILHKVKRKETLYYLSKHYGIAVEQIMEFNPGMKQLKKGETIRIPQWESQTGTSDKNARTTPDREIIHSVEAGETLYSISRRYGLPVTAILERNPEARELKAGMKLTIIPSAPVAPAPSGNAVTSETHPLHPDGAGVIRHVVTGGQTLFGLSRDYKVPVSEIIRHNPFLESRTIQPGDTLLVYNPGNDAPVDGAGENDPESLRNGKIRDCIPGLHTRAEMKTYRIALLIPILLKSNKSFNAELLTRPEQTDPEAGTFNSDSVRTKRKPITQVQFQGNSENYIHFYEGVLLAVDSLQQNGIHIKLDVWDTEQKSSVIKNLISSGNLKEVDLIIGPVYPNEQKEVFEFAAKNKIPVVSPLSPSDEYTRDNPYCFQINPSREFISDRTNRYVVSAYGNSNILVLQTSNSGNEAENEMVRLKDILNRNGGSTGSATISICNFRKDGYAGLREKLDRERKNVIVIPSGNEAEVSVAVSNIKPLVTDFEIVLIGSSRFPQFESISPDHFHQGQLEFLTPYWPDMAQPVTRSFINKFRMYFKSEPNQYSMQGHDVTFFFVKALHDFGSDFRSCITSEKAQLVQGSYHFVQRNTGGYLNTGLNVVQYLPSYSIIRKKVLTE